MALTYDDYDGDGVTATRTVNFPYISQSHVKAQIVETAAAVALTWQDATTVVTEPVPGVGETLRIYRDSSKAARLSGFTPGRVTTEELETDSKQAFYLSQEALDQRAQLAAQAEDVAAAIAAGESAAEDSTTAQTAARIAGGVVRATKALMVAAITVDDIGKLGIAEKDESNGGIKTSYEIISNGMGGATIDEATKTAMDVVERIARAIEICSDLSALSAAAPLEGAGVVRTVYLDAVARSGMFIWRPGDFTSAVSLDTESGIYVESSIPGFDRSVGAWVRQYEGHPTPMFYGADPTGVELSTAALQCCIVNNRITEIPTGVSIKSGPLLGLPNTEIRGGGKIIFDDLDIGESPFVDFSGMTNVELQGITIDASGQSVGWGFGDGGWTVSGSQWFSFDGCDGVRVKGCRFLGNGLPGMATHCIFGDGAKNIRVVDNDFIDIASACVRIAAGESVEVSGNYFENIQYSGHSFSNRPILCGATDTFTIAHNRFANIGDQSDALMFCIDVGNAKYGNVVNNVAKDVFAFLDLEIGTETPNHIAVIGNHASGLFGAGAFAGKEWGREGILYARAEPGTFYTHVTIIGNTFRGFSHGMSATGPAEMQIIGNIVEQCAVMGIHQNLSYRSVIMGNHVKDCAQDKTYSGFSALVAGIKVVGAADGFDGATVIGNVVTGDLYDHWIYNDVSTQASKNRTIIQGNNCYSTDPTDPYIGFDSQNGVLVSGNVTQAQGPLPVNATSWDLTQSDIWSTANTSPTTVTAVTLPQGHEVSVVVNDNNTTIDLSGTALKGNAGVDYAASSGDILIFRRLSAGVVAVQIVAAS